MKVFLTITFSKVKRKSFNKKSANMCHWRTAAILDISIKGPLVHEVLILVDYPCAGCIDHIYTYLYISGFSGKNKTKTHWWCKGLKNYCIKCDTLGITGIKLFYYYYVLGREKDWQHWELQITQIHFLYNLKQYTVLHTYAELDVCRSCFHSIPTRVRYKASMYFIF